MLPYHLFLPLCLGIISLGSELGEEWQKPDAQGLSLTFEREEVTDGARSEDRQDQLWGGGPFGGLLLGVGRTIWHQQPVPARETFELCQVLGQAPSWHPPSLLFGLELELFTDLVPAL